MPVSASAQFADVISASASVSNPTARTPWTVTLSGGGVSTSVNVPAGATRSLSLTATGLARGTTYTFSTSAVRNDTGARPSNFTAESASATTWNYGSTGLSLSASHNQVTINTTVQNTAQGASWSWFVEKFRPSDGQFPLIDGRIGQPPQTTENYVFYDNEVSPSTSYTYRLRAINQATGNTPMYFPSIGSLFFSITTPSAPAPPPTPAPSFTDTAVVGGMLGRAYADGVAANTTTSYAVAAGGSLPPGLSLNTTTGAITGTPTQQGSFTFAINASGGGGTTGSGNLTIQISPAGNRRNSSGFDSNLAVARRYNGTSWVNLTTMRRFNGTSWVNIIN
jgi:hypothetical protein